jgi:hypothetical protein
MLWTVFRLIREMLGNKELQVLFGSKFPPLKLCLLKNYAKGNAN